MKKPRVSIAMPVYNCVRYVATTVESVLTQTFADFEFIICDAASDDGTLDILRTYERRDPRIRLYSQRDSGMVEALNRSLQLARGEYYARVDADDPSHPQRLEFQVRRLDDDPRLVIVGSCAVAIDPNGDELGDVLLPLTHEEIEAQHLRGNQCIFHSAAVIRMSALRQVGGYRKECQFVEELDLWLRLAEVGRVENLSQKLLAWRRTTDGLVATTASLRGAVLQRVMADAWQRRGLSGRPSVPIVGIISTGDLYRQWGWMALKNRNVRIARRYALRSVAVKPCSIASWRLLCCAVRGH